MHHSTNEQIKSITSSIISSGAGCMPSPNLSSGRAAPVIFLAVVLSGIILESFFEAYFGAALTNSFANDYRVIYSVYFYCVVLM